jgi:DNA-directed RNA polymerase II subunit RPB9
LLQDVASDPTLPRTREVTCPACQHNEAVFFSASSEQVSA